MTDRDKARKVAEGWENLARLVIGEDYEPVGAPLEEIIEEAAKRLQKAEEADRMKDEERFARRAGDAIVERAAEIAQKSVAMDELQGEIDGLFGEVQAVLDALPDVSEEFIDDVCDEVDAVFEDAVAEKRRGAREFRFMVYPAPFPVWVIAPDEDAAERELHERFSDLVIEAFARKVDDIPFTVVMTKADEDVYLVAPNHML